MIKAILKLIVCIIVYTTVYIAANAVLPFSQELTDANSSINPISIIKFMPIRSAWICFVLYFIIRHTFLSRKKLFLNLLFVMFFVSFTQHIDTLFIRSAFPFKILDILTMILSGFFPLLATIPLLAYFFQNQQPQPEAPSRSEFLDIKPLADNKDTITADKKELKVKLILKLGISGILYLFIYFLFGLFIIWRSEESRLFYSSIENNPLIIIPFQILRGILFVIFILPLKNMVKTKKIFIVCICLVYSCLTIDLIIPNALLPKNIRIAHLIEMTISMTLFGIIAGAIIWGKQKKEI